jgi:hypothetical protein
MRGAHALLAAAMLCSAFAAAAAPADAPLSSASARAVVDQSTVREHGPVPTPEAVAACADKVAGDVVAFTGRMGGQHQATCKVSRGGVLAARWPLPSAAG